MLTIVDLHEEKELSSSDLAKVAGGASPAFLNLDGIVGESLEGDHKDWIEVFSF
jgi:hypothetical protein